MLIPLQTEYTLIRQLLQELSDQDILCLPLESSSLFVLAAYACQLCGAHPIPHRLRTPCGGSALPSSDFSRVSGPTQRPSRTVIAFGLWQAAAEVTEAAQGLRNRYLHERIQSHHLHAMLQSNTTLPGFPETGSLDASTQFTARLEVDFRRVATAFVFIDAMSHEERRSMMSPSFLPGYQTLRNRLYPLLCLLKLAIRSQTGAFPDNPIVSNTAHIASHSDVRSTAERFNRDYTILNDSVSLFESVQADYRILQADGEGVK